SFATSSGLRTETISGAYRSICCARRSRFPPAARPTTRNASGNASTTSSVERPTEPVEPRMEILRMLEVRSQKSEVRSQKSEVRKQKAEVRRIHFCFLPSAFCLSLRRHDVETLEVVQDQVPVHVQNR